MKQIVISILILTSCFIKAQDHAISIGLDPAVSIYGGHINVKGLDFITKYTYRSNDHGWSNDEVGLFYERFEKINYENYGVFFNKIVFPKIKNTEFTFGIEASVIHREDYFWSYGFNSEFRYDLNDNFRIGIQGNLKRRTDIGIFRYSNFLLIAYKYGSR